MSRPLTKEETMQQETAALRQKVRELESAEVECKKAERRQTLAIEILEILNNPSTLADSISPILEAIKRETGFDAVGIRLRNGEDFPYYVQKGFSHDFLLLENSLIVRDSTGGPCRDENGEISLECTCGLVLSGKTDPANPLFTQGGSAWINNSPLLLQIPSNQDPRLHPRNNCIHQGYQSVALIPIRAHGEIVGLLQLNDRRRDCFTIDLIRFFEGIGASIGVALMRKRGSEERSKLIEDLQKALSVLSGLIPICAACKKIRDDKGYWNQIEAFIEDHTRAEFSHGICPECAKNFYPEFCKKD
jgi:GAF domain-containing protein